MTEFIYVAGVDYPVYHRQPANSKTRFGKRPYASRFREYCVRRARMTAMSKKSDSARFTLFDFFAGSREEIVVDGRGGFSFKVEGTLGAVNAADYRRCDDPFASNAVLSIPEPSLSFRTPPNPAPRIFLFPGVSAVRGERPAVSDYRDYYSGGKHQLERKMSVLDVYQYIADIGAKRPRTVSELHFFSHAVAGGPVLANSLDHDGQSDSRDPLDVDARIKDFAATGPVGKAGKAFGEAFAVDGLTYIWGCEAFTTLRNLLNQMLRQKSQIANENAKKIIFEWSEDWDISLPIFHGMLGGAAEGRKSEAWSVRGVADLVGDYLNQNLYSQHFANASGREVVAALPATYADYDKRGPTVNQLLHIPMGSDSGDKDDFRSILSFYKTQFTFDFDMANGFSKTYGRGYAIYSPGRTYSGKTGALPPQTTAEQPV